MANIDLKCPSCGSEVNIDESREFGFCSYCGTKVIREKTAVENSGRSAAEEIIAVDDNLAKAARFLEQGDFGKASIYYYKALDATPKSATVYWKLLLCKLNVRNNEELLQKYTAPDSVDSVTLEEISEYSNALRYGSDEQVEEFLSINRQIEDRKADSKIVEETKAFQRKNWILFFVLLFISNIIGQIVLNAVNVALGIFIIFGGIAVSSFIYYSRLKKQSQSLTQVQRRRIFEEYTKSKQFQRLSPKRQERIIANFEKNMSQK